MLKEIKNKKRKGFSLVELIVVIAIIGILAAIAVPKYSAYKESANKKADEVTAKLLGEAALMAYEAGEIVYTAENNKESIYTFTDANVNKVKEYVKGEGITKVRTGGTWTITITAGESDIAKTGTITVKSTGDNPIIHTVDY